VFAVDLLMWFVSCFSLLMLTCSTLFVIYFCIRTILESLFSVLSRDATSGWGYAINSTECEIGPAGCLQGWRNAAGGSDRRAVGAD
jgi:hypothetical protein